MELQKPVPKVVPKEKMPAEVLMHVTLCMPEGALVPSQVEAALVEGAGDFVFCAREGILVKPSSRRAVSPSSFREELCRHQAGGTDKARRSKTEAR